MTAPFAYLRQPQLTAYPRGWLRWWLLGLVAFAWGVDYFQLYKIAPVTKQVIDEFGLSGPEWGYLLAFSWIFYVLGVAVSGYLSDRYGRRVFVVAPLLFYALNALQTALATDVPSLILSRVVAATLMGLASPPCMAAMRDFSPQVGRARAYGLILAFSTLGVSAGNWWAAWLLPVRPDWQFQFFTAAVVALAAFLLVFVFYRDLTPKLRHRVVFSDAELEGDAAPVEDPSRPPERSLLTITRHRHIWILALGLACWIAAFQSMLNYGPLYIVEALGVDAAAAGGVTSLYFLSFTFSLLFSGWLSDRLQVRKSVTAFGALAFAALLILFTQLGQSRADMALMTGFWILLGFGGGFIAPAQSALYSENVEAISPRAMGTASSLRDAIGRIAGLAMNATILNVVALWGWSAWWLIAAGLCVGIVVTMIPARGGWLPGRP